MNVLQVITKTEVGGAQTHLLELCRALHKEMKIAVVAGDSGGDWLEAELSRLDVPLYRLPYLHNTMAPWRVLGAALALARLVRQQRPDLLHAHSAVAGAIARIAGLLTGVPVVYTVHGFGFKRQVPFGRRVAVYIVEWLLAPATAHIICVSRHERDLARWLPLPARRIDVIGNTVADHPLRAQPGNEPMRAIMVARCAPPKRHDLLLQALAHAATQRGREIPATLVGGGPDLAALQAQARFLGLRDVQFTGDSAQVPQLLATHSVFVLMSDHEGLPIAAIEALRAGLPLLTSDLPGLRELLDHDQEGWLLANQPKALAQALLHLAEQPQLRTRMGEAARRRYQRKCEPQHMAQAVATVYGQILRHE